DLRPGLHSALAHDLTFDAAVHARAAVAFGLVRNVTRDTVFGEVAGVVVDVDVRNLVDLPVAVIVAQIADLGLAARVGDADDGAADGVVVVVVLHDALEGATAIAIIALTRRADAGQVFIDLPVAIVVEAVADFV